MPDAPRLRAIESPPDGEASLRPSDEAVVAGLLAAESWAADELYSRLHGLVERTLRRVLQDAHTDCDDLIQTTFERIVRTLIERRFSGACSLSTWAAAIASNVAIDFVRARIRERGVFSRKGDEDGDVPEDASAPWGGRVERQLEARAELSRLHGILRRMNARHAEVVLLHDMLGFDLAEIAVLTDLSVAAAQSNLVRGRRELLRRSQTSIRGVL